MGHVVVDGGVAGELLESRMPDYVQSQGPERFIGLDGIAETYLYLHTQPRNAWTHEVELRTHVAQW